MIETVHVPRISIDFETAATCDSAAILTFGACTILPNTNKMARDSFYMRATMSSNESYGRTVDTATMRWWDTQDTHARDEVFTGRDDLKDVLLTFIEWARTKVCKDLEQIELWSRGSDFDCKMLQHACLNILGGYPFDFRNHMCQRNFSKLMPQRLKDKVPPNEIKHVAIYDAMYQARIIEVGLQHLMWME